MDSHDAHDEPIALEENPPVPVPRRRAAAGRPAPRAVAVVKNRLWLATTAVGLLVVLVVIPMVMRSRGAGAKQAGARLIVNKNSIPETLAELDAWYPEIAGAPNAAVFYLKAFSALRLGLVDGLVAAVAERRHIYRILTTDRRDFAVLRVGPRYERALVVVP